MRQFQNNIFHAVAAQVLALVISLLWAIPMAHSYGLPMDDPQIIESGRHTFTVVLFTYVIILINHRTLDSK